VDILTIRDAGWELRGGHRRSLSNRQGDVAIIRNYKFQYNFLVSKKGLSF
jgi:hypothetical protein